MVITFLLQVFLPKKEFVNSFGISLIFIAISHYFAVLFIKKYVLTNKKIIKEIEKLKNKNYINLSIKKKIASYGSSNITNIIDYL